MVQSYQVTVTSTPTFLCQMPFGDGKRKVYISNDSGTNHVWIGDANVTTTSGYEIVNQSGQTIGYRQDFELYSGEKLYGVCAAAATASVSILIPGVGA